ncbi:hypothetical protein HNO89_002806 [Sporosarcina luteola]|nr:hypothetical protein [Sporosarcina luteola]
MMHIKVKSKDIRLSLPIPYIILNVAISLVSSKFIQQHVNKWTKESFERKKIDVAFPQLDIDLLKPIIKELKHYKGMVLVDVKAKDGTEVKVKL